jgi:hypothetical protein
VGCQACGFPAIQESGRSDRFGRAGEVEKTGDVAAGPVTPPVSDTIVQAIDPTERWCEE